MPQDTFGGFHPGKDNRDEDPVMKQNIEGGSKEVSFVCFKDFDQYIMDSTGSKPFRLPQRRLEDIGDAIKVAAFGDLTVYANSAERRVIIKEDFLKELSRHREAERHVYALCSPSNPLSLPEEKIEALRDMIGRLKRPINVSVDEALGDTTVKFLGSFLVNSEPSRESLLERDRSSLEVALDFSRVPEHFLERIPEALKSLPERLVIRKGLQLVVGPNGSGKSTFVDGFHLANLARRYGMTVHEYLEECDPSVRAHFNLPAISFGSALKISEYVPVESLDVARGLQKEKDSDRIKYGPEIATIKWTNTQSLSKRQSNDDFRDKFFTERGIKDFKGIFLMDEPEQGMDPWRHKGILEELTRDTNPDGIVVVATNSPVLTFNDSLSRLDLRNPDKGFVS